jgi:cytochrome c peroxidase
MNSVKVAALLVAFVLPWSVGCGGDGGGNSLDRELRAALRDAEVVALGPAPSFDPALVELGRFLMFDKELSGNRDISCATCHHPLLHTGDGLSVSIGTGGRGLGPSRVLGEERALIPRNAPEVFNRGAEQWRTMFWDGRVSGSAETGFSSPAGAALPSHLDSVLAVQAMFPVTSRDEMRGKAGDVDVFGAPNELALVDDDGFAAIWSALMARLTAIPEYVDLFAAAFPDSAAEELDFGHAARAIAAFEIDFWTLPDSPFDRYLAGDDSALADDAKRGALLFYGQARCAECHSGPLLTDQEHHDVAVPQVGPGKGGEAPLDYGRGRETGELAQRYAFRTPPLRNVAITGPWMHDGAYTTLAGAVRHMLDPASSLLAYDPSQLAPALYGTFQDDATILDAILANLDEKVLDPVLLSDAQVADLLAFLTALTDPAAADLRGDIPDRVPSGLPVAD